MQMVKFYSVTKRAVAKGVPFTQMQSILFANRSTVFVLLVVVALKKVGMKYEFKLS